MTQAVVMVSQKATVRRRGHGMVLKDLIMVTRNNGLHRQLKWKVMGKCQINLQAPGVRGGLQ